MRKKKNSYKSFWIILLLGIIWITFNKSGIIKWMSLYYTKQEGINQLSKLKKEESIINNHIYKLKEDLQYIEFLAYSKFKMVKPGEKIFRIKDTKQVINK